MYVEVKKKNPVIEKFAFRFKKSAEFELFSFR